MLYLKERSLESPYKVPDRAAREQVGSDTDASLPPINTYAYMNCALTRPLAYIQLI